MIMMVKICPACQNKTSKVVELNSREDFLIKINVCSNCGHYFQDSESYKDLYSSGEFSLSARQSLEPTREKIKQLDKKAFERIKFYGTFIDRQKKVLEVGSSIGSFLHLLKMMGKDVQGLEPDPVYASFSKKQYFFEQEASLLEHYDSTEKFDVVCSFHVIEHVQHLNSFVEKVWSLLDSNGAILFECPSLDIHSYGDMKFTIWKPHMHYFTLSSMYALISQKFKVIKLGYYGMAMYVYAFKSSQNTFSIKEFNHYKRISQQVSNLVSLTPATNIYSIKKNKAKQFLLQPFLQKDTKAKLSKYFSLSSFAFKSILYQQFERGVGQKATHVSYYSAWENAGDTVLSKAVRKVFNSKIKNGWNLKNIKGVVDSRYIEEVNRSKYLLVGGGGLLLPDSNSNDVSGWQWAISSSQLEKIKVPLIVYAIGYNYFKGQMPNDFFIENLRAVIKRADFFSLRNFGSINKVRELVDKSLHSKIVYQPCPTTVINRFFQTGEKTKNGNNNVGINLAFDRYEKRFGKAIYVILDQIALAAKQLEERGYKIYCITHLQGDEKFEISLDRRNVKYKSINLQYTLPQRTIEFYNNMNIVLGARGHAQMIPFGVNTRILSLGSHEKLKYFLEDIDAMEWYEDLCFEPEHLTERLLQRFHEINEGNVKETDEKLRETQEKLYNITIENLNVLNKIII